MNRICVVKDVDDLILGWLDFLSRRRMSRVSRYYWEKFRGEAGNQPHGDRRWRRDKYALAGNIEALQWIEETFPELDWPYGLDQIIVYLPFSVFQWRQKRSFTTPTFSHLECSLYYNKPEIAQSIVTQLAEIDLVKMMESAFRWNIHTLRWVDAFLAKRGATVDLIQVVLNQFLGLFLVGGEGGKSGSISIRILP